MSHLIFERNRLSFSLPLIGGGNLAIVPFAK